MICKQIVSTISLNKCREISVENLYVDVWVKGPVGFRTNWH